jgi:hypothetical protein
MRTASLALSIPEAESKWFATTQVFNLHVLDLQVAKFKAESMPTCRARGKRNTPREVS